MRVPQRHSRCCSRHSFVEKIVSSLAVAIAITITPSFVVQAWVSNSEGGHLGRHRWPSSRLSMCICINCARVTNCAAYHFVETKHEQPHMSKSPTFMPRDGSPTIHVNVRTERNSNQLPNEKSDNNVFPRIMREHEDETARAMQIAAKESSFQSESEAPSKLRGETVYDWAPITTSEYDVVACADFEEDIGCWIRNMPEEIRIANPNFVPS